MLPSWPSCVTSVNDGSGFQMPGVCGTCWTGAHVIAESFSQSGSVPWDDVVGPADVLLVQQIGDVGPGVVKLAVVGRGCRAVERRVGVRALVVAVTVRRVDRVRAVRRPLGDHVQVDGQAPRGVGLEHVVLEHVVLGVAPVVGDLAGVVVAHHVDARGLPVPWLRCTGCSSDPSSCSPLLLGLARRSRPSGRRRCRPARCRIVRSAVVDVGGSWNGATHAPFAGSGTHTGRRGIGIPSAPGTCRSSCRTSGSPA